MVAPPDPRADQRWNPRRTGAQARAGDFGRTTQDRNGPEARRRNRRRLVESRREAGSGPGHDVSEAFLIRELPAEPPAVPDLDALLARLRQPPYRLRIGL